MWQDVCCTCMLYIHVVGWHVRFLLHKLANIFCDRLSETPILWKVLKYWISNTLATWWEGLTHLKRSWYQERLRAGGEGDYRGWDGWMVSLTQWTWVWVNYMSWWWTGRPGMLQSTGSQRVRHDRTTELNWTDRLFNFSNKILLRIPWQKAAKNRSGGLFSRAYLDSETSLLNPGTLQS